MQCFCLQLDWEVVSSVQDKYVSVLDSSGSFHSIGHGLLHLPLLRQQAECRCVCLMHIFSLSSYGVTVTWWTDFRALFYLCKKKSVFWLPHPSEVYSSKTTSAERLEMCALLNWSPVLDSQPSGGPRHWAAQVPQRRVCKQYPTSSLCFLSFQIIVLNFGTQTSNGFPCWKVAAGWT